MPNSYVDLSGLDSPYAAQLNQIQRQQRMADLLRQQLDEPIPVQTGGGAPAPISWGSVLGKVLGGVRASMLENKGMDQLAQIRDARAKALANAAVPVGDATVMNGPMQSAPLPGGGKVDYITPQFGDTNEAKRAKMLELLQNGIGESNAETLALQNSGLGGPLKVEKFGKTDRGIVIDPITNKATEVVSAAPEAPTTQGGMQYDVKTNQWTPIPGYEDQQAHIRAAGRPVTSVNVNADKSFGTTLGGNVANVLDASAGSAKGAVQTIDAARQVLGALDAPGGVSTGPGAKFGQFINQVTGNDPAKVENTRNAIQGLARLTVGARSALKGQGQISDYEGKLLQRASSGDINDMTAGEIRIVANVADRLARMQIRQNQDNVAKARKVAGSAQGMVDFYDVPEPPAYAPTKPNGPTRTQSGATVSNWPGAN